MAKKSTISPPQKERVFSKNYNCLITKDEAYFDKDQNSWLSEKIEKVIGRGRKIGTFPENDFLADEHSDK